MVEIKDLFDLDKTIAKKLFEGKTYPWEVLDEIKEFILALGPTLDPEEFDQPYEGVWVAKDAKVFPSAFLGAPCIIDHGAEVRHCAFIRGSAIVGKNAVVGRHTNIYPTSCVRGVIPANSIYKDKVDIVLKHE